MTYSSTWLCLEVFSGLMHMLCLEVLGNYCPQEGLSTNRERSWWIKIPALLLLSRGNSQVCSMQSLGGSSMGWSPSYPSSILSHTCLLPHLLPGMTSRSTMYPNNSVLPVAGADHIPTMGLCAAHIQGLFAVPVRDSQREPREYCRPEELCCHFFQSRRVHHSRPDCGAGLVTQRKKESHGGGEHDSDWWLIKDQVATLMDDICYTAVKLLYVKATKVYAIFTPWFLLWVSYFQNQWCCLWSYQYHKHHSIREQNKTLF